MSKEMVLAVAAGALSAVVASTLLAGNLTALFLAYMAPMPLLLVGLGLGFPMVGISAAVGIVLSGIFGGVLIGGIYAISHALPVLMVSRLALAPVVDASGKQKLNSPGVILSWLTVVAGAMFALGALFFMSGNGIEAKLAQTLDETFKAMAPTLEDKDRAEVTRSMAAYFPAMVASSWAVMVIMNAIFAQGILARAGRALRSAGKFKDLTLPNWTSWVLVLSAALALIGPGELEYIGHNLVMIEAIPFFFVGLAVVHTLAGYVAFPGMLLAAMYFVLMVSGWFAFVLVGIGLIEQWFGLRVRFAPPSNNQEVE